MRDVSPFGPGAQGTREDRHEEMKTPWTPLVRAQAPMRLFAERHRSRADHAARLGSQPGSTRVTAARAQGPTTEREQKYRVRAPRSRSTAQKRRRDIGCSRSSLAMKTR